MRDNQLNLLSTVEVFANRQIESLFRCSNKGKL